MTTPNIVDLDSRRQFLIQGDLWEFPRGCVSGLRKGRSGHLTILPYWILEEILDREDGTCSPAVSSGVSRARA